MKNVKKFLAAVLALAMCMSFVSAADNYGPITFGYGEDWGDSGFYFEDCLHFDALAPDEAAGYDDIQFYIMKPGSSVHFFKAAQFDDSFMEDFTVEGGGIGYFYCIEADEDRLAYESEYNLIRYNGKVYVPNEGEYYSEKKSMTSDELFCSESGMVDMVVFWSVDVRYVIVLEGGASTEPTTPTAPAAPTQPATPQTAIPTASTVMVNGKQVAFDAYNIGGNNFFKLRDMAYVLSGSEKQFEVTWDGAKNAINLVSGTPYTAVGGEMAAKGDGNKQATPTTSVIYLDGVQVTLTAYNIGGNNYFKLRDLGQAFDFEVDWDAAAATIVIDTTKTYTPD